MSTDLIVNSTGQLFGWSMVLVMIALTACHLGALFLAASRIAGDQGRLYRWTAVLYVSVPALMAVLGTLSATGTVGWPFPTFVFPWVGSAADINSLTAMAWVLGSVIALAARIPPAEARAGGSSHSWPD